MLRKEGLRTGDLPCFYVFFDDVFEDLDLPLLDFFHE